jgi:hypothetical protein
MAKKKLTIWAEEDVVDYLNYEATSQNASLSEVANTLLKRAFIETKDLTGAELISVTLKNELNREFAGLANRIRSLMSRTALEAMSARYLAYQLVVEAKGEEAAKGMNRAAWNFAVNQLKNPSREFRELLRQWREEKEGPAFEVGEPELEAKP